MAEVCAIIDLSILFLLFGSTCQLESELWWGGTLEFPARVITCFNCVKDIWMDEVHTLPPPSPAMTVKADVKMSMPHKSPKQTCPFIVTIDIY